MVERAYAVTNVVDESERVVWPVFKTIRVGTVLGYEEDFFQTLSCGSCRVDTWAQKLLYRHKTRVARHEADINLAVVSNAALGRLCGCTFRRTCALALATGWLGFCRPEDAIQLRRQYCDQPRGECLIMGMHPLESAMGDLEIFLVCHTEEGRLLSAGVALPSTKRFGNAQFIFRLLSTRRRVPPPA